MSSDVAAAYGLGKKYRLGGYDAAYAVLREKLVEAIRSGFRRTAPAAEQFWALRDVSFAIGKAEVVGLVGRNGAGKSTLLKILSQITEPTEGEVHLWGRVASLLEVGIGFHSELTGRENVYLNGAILGMSRNEIRRKFDEIVEFSGVEAFLDTPVKRYSSGMYVRLAFAVAAHLEPDLLIIDEVLAVGDAAFQQKCLGKVQSFSQAGRSVVIVSHNMPMINALCDRVIWLDQGRVVATGRPAEIVGRYLSQNVESTLTWIPRHPSSDVFHYHSISVMRGDTGEATDAFPGDAPIDVVFDFTVHRPLPPGRLLMRVATDQGQVVFTSTSADGTAQSNHPWKLGRQKLRCTIPANFLAPARYLLTVSEPAGDYEHVRQNVVSFNVSEENSLAARDARPGVVAPILLWRDME